MKLDPDGHTVTVLWPPDEYERRAGPKPEIGRWNVTHHSVLDGVYVDSYVWYAVDLRALFGECTCYFENKIHSHKNSGPLLKTRRSANDH